MGRLPAATITFVSLLINWGTDVVGAQEEPGQPASPSAAVGSVVDWRRAGLDRDSPSWGIRGHLEWGLPVGLRPSDGPRGLIRLRAPVLADGEYDLINFIAIEPVVGRRRGFSELERSQADGVQGKRLWLVDLEDPNRPEVPLYPGQLTRLASGVESLAVRVRVEKFQNGAHVSLTITQRSDTPDQVELAIEAEADSAPIEYCILTATMGNKARTRRLWLKGEIVSSLQLYPDFQTTEFAPHHFFALDRLHRTAAGDVVVAITTDESEPAAVDPFPQHPFWRYAGSPVTQYWLKPAGTWRDDLRVAVNGRYTYYLSRQPLPGGIAFENFEMLERFYQGQRFVFGVTKLTPAELGF